MKCFLTHTFSCGLHLPLIAIFMFFSAGRAAAEKQVKTELYFGLSSPSGPVSDSAWDSFVEQQVTPAFSEGFTVVDATGRWSDNGVSKSELSKILIYYHPDSKTADAHIENVQAAYVERFDQQAVLRIDIPAAQSVGADADGNEDEKHLVPLLLALVAVLTGILLYVLFRTGRQKHLQKKQAG